MPSKKKIEEKIEEIAENNTETTEQVEEITEQEEKIEESVVENVEKPVEKIKYPVGSIVFVSKDADADLNGFKLFPPYKKYTYTVEAYDENTAVYSLRRLNLSLRLKEADIVAPNEKGNDKIKRIQF
jgi:enoyl-[acyl-carrier-protein] reductase (NADH)